MSQTRIFEFTALDKISIKQRMYRWHSKSDLGHMFVATLHPGEPIPEGFTHVELDKMQRDDELHVEPNFYSEGQTYARWTAGGVTSLLHLKTEEQRIVMRRQEWCDEILLREEFDPEFKRTYECLKETITAIHPAIIAREMARVSGGKRPRCDQKLGDSPIHAPSARTVLRWLVKYDESGCDPIVLRDGHWNSGNVMSDTDTEVKRLMTARAAQYASKLKPSITKQYERLCKDIKDLNEKRAPDDQLQIPAKSTFTGVIKKIPAIQIEAGRNPAKAQAKFFVVRGGQDVMRAGQHVQFDGTRVHVITLAAVMEEIGKLSAATIEKFEKERLHVILGIDVASKCILGVRVSKTENKEAALQAFKMACSDKSAYAAAAGCKSDWPMMVRPGIVETDTGSAFHSNEWRTAVANLRGRVRNAPVGVPQLRGSVERMFRTINTQFLTDYSGVTFENVEARGDYDSGAEASMMSEELGPLLVRWIVDVYHHRPHAGLNGMTPYDKWHELVAQYGLVPPPGRDELRNVFGTTLERALDQRGIRVAGIHYQSEAIQAYRREYGDCRLSVKFDEEDLGRISVWLGDSWHPVPAARGNFAGVRLAQWTETMNDLRRRNAVKAKMSEHLVNQALADLAEAGRRFMTRADIADPAITPAQVENLERGIMAGFDIADDPQHMAERDADGAADLFGSAIKVEGEPPNEVRRDGPANSAGTNRAKPGKLED